jgi:hypothetical protein
MSLRYESFDHVLGVRSERFFGSGYTRVSQSLSQIASHASEGTSRVEAFGAVSYPPDWSRKGVRSVSPHLGSLDMVALACSAVEVALAHAGALDEEQLGAARFSRIDVRTGSEPLLDLASIPVTAVRGLPTASEAMAVSDFDVRVGGARVSLRAVHDPGRTRVAEVVAFDSASDALGSSSERLYGDAYKSSIIETDQVMVDPDLGTAEAVHTLSSATATRGIEAAYLPGLTYLDALITAAQLSQILVYAIDGIDREGSNTFWLRRMTLSSGVPLPTANPLRSQVRVVRHRILERPASTWSSVDLAVQVGAVRIGASVAHQLPRAAVPA